MTEDNRISEIRAELDQFDGSGSAFLPVDEHDRNLLDRIRAILDRPAPAPRVFLPGDVVPAGIDVQSADRNVYRWATVRQLLPYEGPMVEVPYPSPEEWQAAIDRAEAERPEVQP